MANFCDYEVRVNGTKQAAYLVMKTMPVLDYLDVEKETGTEEKYEIRLVGNCKWSVNFETDDSYNEGHIDFLGLPEEVLDSVSEEYQNFSLRAKSQVFGCEILVHYWSEESGFDQFDHYKNGECIKKRKIWYDETNKFDWKSTEFVGHEGEYDESVDGEEADADFMSKIMQALGGGGQNDDNYTEDEFEYIDSKIVGTGYDLFDWTFTEGKTAKGDGWSIAVPDGFIVRNSKERPFEIVPLGYEESVVEQDEIPMCLLPGNFNSLKIPEKHWFYHPNARKGIAEVFGKVTDEQLASFMGAHEILSHAWGDLCSFTQIQNTGNASYSYQIHVCTQDGAQMLRVQTLTVSDEQNKRLKASINFWLETFKCDKPNEFVDKMSKFEKPECLEELKNNKTTLFNEAVDKANIEYKGALNIRLETIQYMIENGVYLGDLSDRIRNLLLENMEIKEFYYKKADELVDTLISEGVSKTTLKKVYKKLDEMEDFVTSINVDEDAVTIGIPKIITEIINKWNADK